MRAHMLQNVVVDEKVLTEKIENYTDSEIPDCCLYCESEDLDISPLYSGNLDTVWGAIRCCNCGARWRERYEFVRLELL